MAKIVVGSDGTASPTAVFVDHDDRLLDTPFVSPVGYGFFVQHGQTLKVVRQASLTSLDLFHRNMGNLGDP